MYEKLNHRLLLHCLVCFLLSKESSSDNHLVGVHIVLALVNFEKLLMMIFNDVLIEYLRILKIRKRFHFCGYDVIWKVLYVETWKFSNYLYYHVRQMQFDKLTTYTFNIQSNKKSIISTIGKSVKIFYFACTLFLRCINQYLNDYTVELCLILDVRKYLKK